MVNIIIVIPLLISIDWNIGIIVNDDVLVDIIEIISSNDEIIDDDDIDIDMYYCYVIEVLISRWRKSSEVTDDN